MNVSNCLVTGCYGQFSKQSLNQWNSYDHITYHYTLVDFPFFHGRPTNDYSVYDSNDCSINQPGGGIAIINPSLSQVNICVLTNKTRGFFVLRNTGQGNDTCSLNVNDTIISSNLDSSLIMTDSSQTAVNFCNTNITDHIKAVTPNSSVQYTNRFDQMKINLQNKYFVWEHYSPLAFEITNQQLNCYSRGSCDDYGSVQGTCVDSNSYTAMCPFSYVVCDVSDKPNCKDNHKCVVLATKDSVYH